MVRCDPIVSDMVRAMMSPPSHPARFSGDQLACRRGGRLVFSSLSFALDAGAALTLRGPNGSGKTTLLRLMAGLAQPFLGALRWRGQPIEDGFGRQMRFVGHLDAIKPALTARENLAFWSSLYGGRDGDVMAALAAFDLARLADFPARLFSAGQRHRLALARLKLGAAPLWLLDEPTNTLDDAALGALRRAIADHRAAGGLVVIASHGEALVDDATTLNLAAFHPLEESAEAA